MIPIKHRLITAFVALLLSTMLSCTITGCTNEEQVELGAWKEKLEVADGNSTIDDALNDINRTIDDTAAKLDGVTAEGKDKITEAGNTISNTLKEWADVDLGFLTETPAPKGTQAPQSNTEEFKQETNSDGSRIKVKFIKVVDGDTIYVELNGEKTRVRLIGINTAESVAPYEYLQATGKENTQEGKFASDYLKELMKDVTEVWLEFDLEMNDDYGRVLAYVWLDGEEKDGEKSMLNIIMVRSGWAEPMTIEPNSRYKEQIAIAAEEAE